MSEMKPPAPPEAGASGHGSMKSCFGRELAARFGPGTMPIGTDVNSARTECYSCSDFDRCAVVVNLVMALKQRREEEKKSR